MDIIGAVQFLWSTFLFGFLLPDLISALENQTNISLCEMNNM